MKDDVTDVDLDAVKPMFFLHFDFGILSLPLVVLGNWKKKRYLKEMLVKFDEI